MTNPTEALDATKRCACVDVEIQSYKNTVVVKKPPQIYSDDWPTVCIDKCILPEIQQLWRLGVRTYGSCCGHNKLNGMINVDDRDADIMAKLGYEQWPIKEGFAPYTYFPRSIPINREIEPFCQEPTDATRFKSALYAQCPEPVADDIWERFESLTAKLTAAQAEAKAAAKAEAEAKAWEAWGLSQHNALQDALYLITLSQTAWDYEADELLQNTEEDCNAPKPQPVDASPLARIARVALEALIPCEGGCTCSMCVLSQTLAPNDIALAQALVGGA